MKKIISIGGVLGFFVAQAISLSAAYFNPTPITRCETQITKTLHTGSQNSDVYVLQTLLINSGFLNAQPNGYFGSQTAQALRAFQLNNAIPATGTVGPITRNAINERLCDVDLVDNNNSYNNSSYNYAQGITHVLGSDPYVQVISPIMTTPTVYATPQNNYQQGAIGNAFNVSSLSSTGVNSQSSFVPQIASAGIVYNPSTGYGYGIVPQSGSLTVSVPVANSTYQEGDTVYVQWSTNNLQTSPYSILLESTITGQSKLVAVVTGNSYSFTLTKELLDAICLGICNSNANQQGSFRIVVSMPTTDIAGINSTLRAAIAPITIRRPLAIGKVSLTASKTPVNSAEVFRLYVNVPINTLWNTTASETYSIRLKANCVSAVTVSIAGTLCGQEFSMPFSSSASQQEVPVSIVNVSWYKQDVMFTLTVVNQAGQVIGIGQTNATVNPAPFSW